MPTVNTRIPNRERLIFALDVPSLEEARALISSWVIRLSFTSWGWKYFCPVTILN